MHKMFLHLLAFFALAFGAAWTCWFVAGMGIGTSASSTGLDAAAGALFLLGTISPALVALTLTDRTEGRGATLVLLRRTVQANVDLRWYAFAVFYMPAIKLTAALIHRLATGAWPRFGTEPWYLMAGAILISTWVQAGEEIGWRGYALPRLASRVGLGPASVILGVVWAAWHAPLFVFRASDLLGQSFPLFLAEVTALSVAMSWLYWRTSGSLLLVMVLHAAVNNTKDIVPSVVVGATNSLALSTSLVAWITVALLWLSAGYFLARMTRLGARNDGYE
jgi:uncharacterized protein